MGLSIEADQYGPTSGIASLNVMTAEADSVHDNTAYAPISCSIAFPTSDTRPSAARIPVNPQNQQFGGPLSGQFTAGSHLSSRVVATGTAGSNSIASAFDGSTLSKASLVDASNVTGTVGSDCDVIGGPTLSDSSLDHDGVAVAQRRRERLGLRQRQHGEHKLVERAAGRRSGVTSDIAEISGMPVATAFAIQISYDDRINTFLNGSSGSATADDAYL